MSNKPIKPSPSGKMLDAETWDALREAGVPEAELEHEQPCGPIIFSYTRAQAIEDGVLADVTPIARAEGFTLHTAMTCGVSRALLEMVRRQRPNDFTRYPVERIQRAANRAMLQVLHEQIAQQKQSSDRLYFQCGDQKLWAHLGPGDNGEPVLTIMLPGED